MKYTEEMILRSQSGYCMPFEETEGKDVSMSLGYGEQTYPTTGEPFFHHGVDFDVRRYLLSAVADGTVSGIGSNGIHGMFLTVRYGKYEVTYAHIGNVFVNYGQTVRAGQTVAMSGDLLHIGTRFDGEEIDPLDFLTMLYGNVMASQQTDFGNETALTLDASVPYTEQELEALLWQWLPDYLEAIRRGWYEVPERTALSLRNIFSIGASKRYFFETMPSMSNPLGIGRRSLPLVGKVQNLLITDFLNYLKKKNVPH